jgi:hypothetical protein
VYPAGQATVHLNNALVVLDDFLRDPQTQTPAEIFLGSEEGLKDLLDVFGFNPCLGFSRTPRPVPSARAYVAEFEEEWRQRPSDLALTGRIDHLSDIRPLIRNLLSSVNAWTAGVVTGLAQEDVRNPARVLVRGETPCTCVQHVCAGTLPLDHTSGALATPPELPTEQ